jgi:chromosome partitioning protein
LAQGEPSVYDFLLSRIEYGRIVKTTDMEHLHIIPSSQDLIGAEVEFVSLDSRESILRSVVNNIRNYYDYIFIDCPPSLGFLTLNALVAADSVLIPVQCEYYALEGVGNLMRTVRRVQNNLNQSLEIEGFLLTMFDSRNNLSHQVVADVRNHFTSLVFDSIIPRNVRLSESPSFGKPVCLYDITSSGAIRYLSLAKEIMNVEGDRTSQKAYSVGAGS